MVPGAVASLPVVREIRPAEFEPARALIMAGLAEHWGELDASLNPDLDRFPAAFAHGAVFVALEGDVVVGVGALIPEAADAGRIVRMSVARVWRRKGVASRLLDELIMAARRRDYRRVVLETTASWHDAVQFYLRYGFRTIGERDGDMHFELNLEMLAQLGTHRPQEGGRAKSPLSKQGPTGVAGVRDLGDQGGVK